MPKVWLDQLTQWLCWLKIRCDPALGVWLLAILNSAWLNFCYYLTSAPWKIVCFSTLDHQRSSRVHTISCLDHEIWRLFYTVRPWDLRDSIPSRQDTWGHLGGWQRALRFTTWCISDIVVKGWNKRFQWIKRSARIKPNGDVWYLLKKLPCQILEASLAALAWEKVQSANGCRRRFECRACWCFVGPKSWRVSIYRVLKGGVSKWGTLEDSVWEDWEKTRED